MKKAVLDLEHGFYGEWYLLILTTMERTFRLGGNKALSKQKKCLKALWLTRPSWLE